MITVELILLNKSGLHARPASHIVNTLKNFKADVQIVNATKRCNARSLTGLLTLGAYPGTKLIVIADGVDENKAVAELKNIIENGDE